MCEIDEAESGMHGDYVYGVKYNQKYNPSVTISVSSISEDK